MLDGLLGRGFSVKCKSLIKTTRSRIDLVRRRAEAKQRFLKEDLAKLLSNGLDINAYGRTEEYIAALNLLFCYDFIEQSCEYIIKQLSRMQKQRECPEECKDAVASLMFAAARFSDLPELRDLRDTFQDRYGIDLEAVVNQKFVQKLSSRPPTTDKRLNVLQDIAAEFSIKWDSKGFEQRLASPKVIVQSEVHKADMMVKQRQGLVDEKSRVRSYGEGNMGRRGEVDYNRGGVKDAARLREQPLLKMGESSSQGETDDIRFHASHAGTENKHLYPTEQANRERSSRSSHGKLLDNGHIGNTRPSKSIPNAKKQETKDGLFDDKVGFAAALLDRVGRKHENDASRYDGTNDYMGGKFEEESSRLNPLPKHALPPPYVKSKHKVAQPHYVKPNENELTHCKASVFSGSDRSDHVVNPVSSNNCSGSSNNKPGYDEQKEHLVQAAKTKSNGQEKDFDFEEEPIPLPKPRSVRRKHHKLSSENDDVGIVEDINIPNRSRRKDHSRRGLWKLFDEEHRGKDNEERILDKLLIHYSKKPSMYDEEVEKVSTRERVAGGKHRMIADVGELLPPTRSVSLPHEQQIASPESVKVFNRANSFQPEIQSRHVHPKLPDYDDLAARFAALKGR